MTDFANTQAHQIPNGVAYTSNAGLKPYRFEILTSTDYVAVRKADGTVSVFTIGPTGDELQIATSNYVHLWACASRDDSTRAGELLHLGCADNDLGDLDVRNCGNLENLICHNNRLISLDLSSCKALRSIDCDKNSLQSLKLGKLKMLYHLNCAENQLESLDISGCDELGHGMGRFDCAQNPLTHIVLSGAQLEGNILSGQLGGKGRVDVVCGQAYRAWALSVGKQKLPRLWSLEVVGKT